MQFTKMHGAGNDYIYLNGFVEQPPDDLPAVARAVSDRRRGIGADGLIVGLPSTVADARMRMFNADGSEAEMCGNGLRCLAKLLVDRQACAGPALKIETLAGVLSATIVESRGSESTVRVDMGPPRLAAAEIPTTLPAANGRVVDTPITAGGVERHATCVSMGNPHCVIFVEQATDDLVLGAGPQLERHAAFPEGANVEFVEVLSRSEVRQRTWERGSGETWACGTGAAAVCVAGVLTGKTDRKVTVHLRGGDLLMDWDETTGSVLMTGPAVEVFTGTWYG